MNCSVGHLHIVALRITGKVGRQVEDRAAELRGEGVIHPDQVEVRRVNGDPELLPGLPDGGLLPALPGLDVSAGAADGPEQKSDFLRPTSTRPSFTTMVPTPVILVPRSLPR